MFRLFLPIIAHEQGDSAEGTVGGLDANGVLQRPLLPPFSTAFGDVLDAVTSFSPDVYDLSRSLSTPVDRALVRSHASDSVSLSASLCNNAEGTVGGLDASGA